MPAAETLCADCDRELRPTRVEVEAGDEARGYRIAMRAQVEAHRQSLPHPWPALRPGCFAKLSFVTVPCVEPRHIESMWVQVEGRDGELWHGRVDNEPVVLASLGHGDLVHFASSQVLAVRLDQSSRELPDGDVSELCDPEKRSAYQELDAGDLELLGSVRRYGFTLIRIPAGDDGPGFAFTVGLAHRLGHPELIAFGDEHSGVGQILYELALQVARGRRFEAGDGYDGLLGRARGRFVPVTTAHEDHYRDYLGYACWFHRRTDFPVLQLEWSDSAGRFPADAGFTAGGAGDQVLLSR